MKKNYFTLILLFFVLLTNAQFTPTGSSAEIGITDGQLSVSLSGAATYTVPIAVPPGINGVVPQISLVYNSQESGGNAGYGWNISGVSSITRIASTKYHDGIIDPVDFDNLDRFALDGQRLIVKNGSNITYGANGTVYETESFSNVKITSYGVHPNGANYGPAYFVIEYPDGSKAYYGNSSDSRSITRWSITYWENPQGVRIAYSYVLTNNLQDIASIKYGSVGASAPINEIRFNYATTNYPDQSYIGGQSIIRSKRLESINVIGNAVGFRNYSLTYADTNIFDKLISITEKSGDNAKSYNPLVFYYDSGTSSISAKQSNSSIGLGEVNGKNSATVSGDFDGDGKMDFVLYPTLGTTAKKDFWLFANVGSGAMTIPRKAACGYYDAIFTSKGLTPNNKMYHYDGVTVAKLDTDPNTVNFETWNYGTYGLGIETNRKVVFPERYVATYDCNNSQAVGQAKYFFSGDFNGDGLTDVIALDKELSEVSCEPDRYGGPDIITYSVNSSNQLYFVDLDRRKTTAFVNYAGTLRDYFFSSDSKIEAFDVNGDGKTDILHFKNGKVTVYSLNSSNQLEFLWEKVDTEININAPILIGDYNGDGKLDFIIPKGTGSTAFNYVKFLSTGNGFEKTAQTYTVANIGYSEDAGSINTCDLIPLDINGDGKTDFVQFKSLYSKSSGAGRVIIDIYKNSNGTFLSPSGLTYRTDPSTSIRTYPIPIFLSPKMSNQFLAVGAISNDRLYEFNLEYDFMMQHLIKRITNGNGVQKSISYSSLQQDQYEPYYSPTIFVENFPNVDIISAPNIKIVTLLEEQGKSYYKKQFFNYSGAVTNLDGIGFLGFRSTSKTNWYEKNEQIITTLSKNDLNLRGANVENYTVLGLHLPLYPSPNSTTTAEKIVKELNYTLTGTDNLVATQSIILKPDVWIKSGSTFSARINEDANAGTSPNTPTDFITKTLLNYESELLPNKVFRIKNTKIKEYNNPESTSSETSISYDGNGNAVKSVNLLKQSGATVQTTITDVDYVAPTVSPYVLGRVSGKKQSITVSGDIMNSEEQYVYTNSLLTQVKKKGTGTNYITEDNVFDSFGNITQKTISATGLLPRVTSYIYDPSGRFVTKKTDIEGLSTDFAYNYSNGTITSETNSYGLKTMYEYDGWLKKTKITDYLGKNKTFTYVRNVEKSVITTTGDDGSISEETFDERGRAIKAGTKKITGTFSYVDYLYDIYDRNYKVSEPYLGTSATQWNETKYDVYGKVIQNNAFNGKITDITYSGLGQTVNDGTKSKMSVKNAIGNIISVTDTPGGTINYTYFANGNLKAADYGGVKSTISQDGWGRRTKLDDSSAGVYYYEYNEFGETTKESTPNGTTTYTLNTEGKITQKVVSGTNTNSKTTYTYDSSTKLLLKSEFEDLTNGTNKIITIYTYDTYKRIVKTVETTAYATFTKDFTYDAFGRIETETSTAAAGGKTTSKKIKNTYKNGLHWQILDNNTNAVLWQVNTVNARGQLTSAQNGPTTITNTYDTFGFASQFKYDKTADSSNILTLNMVFDVKLGNLTSRTNSLMGTSESFKYDELDRLVEFTNAQGVQEKQLYDDRGRITENNSGKYTYSNDKLYQNSGITVSPDAATYYSARPSQNISYNAFKSPVQIEEAGVDKISFDYNDNNSRTAMFYGGLQTDKLQRSFAKYYSADGTMEVKHNLKSGAVEFVTYIGGDGYTAPLVVKSDGNTENYLYLQRDYQGSIVAVIDQAGAVVEKRMFDAWGEIVKVQDGAGNVLTGLTVLDRGYTGHEHLQSVRLINMNGRIYDPKLHRFLQPDNFVQDPFNTQNFNRYSYVLNNPLKYTDYSGEKFKLSFNDIFAGIEIIAGAVLTYFSAGTLSYIGVGLIAAGVGHFAATYNEFKQTGDWGAASKNSGVFFNLSFKTDFGYDSNDKQNGVVQNAPVVNPKSTSGGKAGASGSGGDDFVTMFNNTYSRHDMYNFYDARIHISSENGTNNWSMGGTIHTSQAFYDGYMKNGINSYHGLLLMHEYGHYLHAQNSPLNFYSYGMWSSMLTANSATASSNWTEVMANTMAYYYFHYPSVFNNHKKDYPINPNYLSDELKYKLYYHLKL